MSIHSILFSPSFIEFIQFKKIWLISILTILFYLLKTNNTPMGNFIDCTEVSITEVGRRELSTAQHIADDTNCNDQNTFNDDIIK